MTLLLNYLLLIGLEYQPILDKVNKNKIPWMLLDDLHLISLNTVLKKMKVKNITEEKKKN